MIFKKINENGSRGGEVKVRGRVDVWGRVGGNRNSGFVALFFVLIVASSLTILVFELSRSFSYTLSMLDSFKENDNARSSALFCKYKLFNNVLSNIEYAPVLNTDLYTPYGGTCIYTSFKKIGLQTNEAIIVGNANSSQAQNFTIKYVYSINNKLHDYLQNIETIEIN